MRFFPPLLLFLFHPISVSLVGIYFNIEVSQLSKFGSDSTRNSYVRFLSHAGGLHSCCNMLLLQWKILSYTGCVTGNWTFLKWMFTEQAEGVEAWVGGQLNSSGHAISVAVMPQWTLEHHVFAYDSFVKKW